jgi:hypothetical protein
METASFAAIVWQERYSAQQEKASKKVEINRLLLKFVCLMFSILHHGNK